MCLNHFENNKIIMISETFALKPKEILLPITPHPHLPHYPTSPASPTTQYYAYSNLGDTEGIKHGCSLYPSWVFGNGTSARFNPNSAPY